MAININYYLNNKLDEVQIPHAIKTEELYNGIPDRRLKLIFATLHQEFNRLINFMYKKQMDILMQNRAAIWINTLQFTTT